MKKIIEISKAEWILNTTDEKIEFDNVQTSTLSQTGSLSFVKGDDLTKRSANLLKLVYIIFTSGSTGEPKGVQINDKAIQSYVRWLSSKDFEFTHEDVFVNTTVLSFDLSTYEVMSFGAVGGAILLSDKETASNPDLMVDRVQQYKGSIWISTPSFAINYSRLENENALVSIRKFIFAGEILPNKLAETILLKFPLAEVFNSYGPTEATNTVTLVKITEEMINRYHPLP